MSEAGSVEARLVGSLGDFRLDVAFSAPAGVVTALVGPSGSGKSTLLRALAGLERFQGEVRLGDVVWQDGRSFMPAHRRPVGYVFQHAALLPHLSVRRNLDYGRRRAGVKGDAFDQVVERLGLQPLLDRSPGRLSGGERQRVAVGRALLTRPGLLLMDEPLSGLDAAAKGPLLADLRRLFEALAIPVIYVSHDPAEVACLTTRVQRLHGGRVVLKPSTADDRDDVLAGLSDDRVRQLAAAAVSAGL